MWAGYSEQNERGKKDTWNQHFWDRKSLETLSMASSAISIQHFSMNHWSDWSNIWKHWSTKNSSRQQQHWSLIKTLLGASIILQNCIIFYKEHSEALAFLCSQRVKLNTASRESDKIKIWNTPKRLLNGKHGCLAIPIHFLTYRWHTWGSNSIQQVLAGYLESNTILVTRICQLHVWF